MAKTDVNLRYDADYSQTIGPTLSKRRKELGLTQETLADLSDVALRLVHELEHNKVSVRLDNLLRILNALGLHLELSPGVADGIVTKDFRSPAKSEKL
jgi:HTH-type transcriptional regulator/antitoxin HipB